jgi:hypothetical protein
VNTHTKKNTELSDSDLDQISGGAPSIDFVEIDEPIIGRRSRRPVAYNQKVTGTFETKAFKPFTYRATRG